VPLSVVNWLARSFTGRTEGKIQGATTCFSEPTKQSVRISGSRGWGHHLPGRMSELLMGIGLPYSTNLALFDTGSP
jgi:hypothetical protein